MKPLVSVIIPAYNAEAYIEQTLDSIYAQSYQNYEVIIIDDGSTDETSKVIANHPCLVRYELQNNAGVSIARNHGLRIAEGQFITFLDADDMWEPTFLQQMVSHLLADNSVAGAYCGTIYMDQKGNPLPKIVQNNLSGRNLYQKLTVTNLLHVGTLLIRRKVFSVVGEFDSTLYFFDDWDMWVRIARHYDIIAVNEPLFLYRQHPHSATHNLQLVSEDYERFIKKHYPLNDISILSSAKHPYLSIYRRWVTTHLHYQRFEDAVSNFLLMIELESSILEDPSMYFEMAYAHLPLPIRGDLEKLDYARAKEDIMEFLTFVEQCLGISENFRTIRAQCLFVLGQLAYALGMLKEARAKFHLAIVVMPKLLLKIRFLRFLSIIYFRSFVFFQAKN